MKAETFKNWVEIRKEALSCGSIERGLFFVELEKLKCLMRIADELEHFNRVEVGNIQGAITGER